MQERLEARVHGRVQMVMYRDYIKRYARRLGLVGYVRNCIDGTVEVVAEGPMVSLKKLVTRMETGSFLSHVDSVDVEYYPIKGGYKSFDISFS